MPGGQKFAHLFLEEINKLNLNLQTSDVSNSEAKHAAEGHEKPEVGVE